MSTSTPSDTSFFLGAHLPSDRNQHSRVFGFVEFGNRHILNSDVLGAWYQEESASARGASFSDVGPLRKDKASGLAIVHDGSHSVLFGSWHCRDCTSCVRESTRVIKRERAESGLEN